MIDITIIDELGSLQHQIAALQEREAVLKAQIKAAGVGAYDGSIYSALVSERTTTKFDTVWKAKVNALIETHISHQFRAAHSSEETTTVLTVKARNKVAA